LEGLPGNTIGADRYLCILESKRIGSQDERKIRKSAVMTSYVGSVRISGKRGLPLCSNRKKE